MAGRPTTKTGKKTVTPRSRERRIDEERQYGNPPKDLSKHIFYGLTLDEEQEKFRDAIWNPDINVIFCNSRAGTGKTTIAVATANLMVRQYGLYDGITYVISPCMEGEIGFLPGTTEEKTKPYATALEQALIECNEQPEKVIIRNGDASVKDGAYVNFIPDTFLRGSNLRNKVVIIDEAQNYNFHALKKVLTRVADDCKLIVIGHDGQRDAHQEGDSAFTLYLEHFATDERTAVCTLTKNYRGWIANHADNLEGVYVDEDVYEALIRGKNGKIGFYPPHNSPSDT